MLGLLSTGGVDSWTTELRDQLQSYKDIKTSSLPDVNRVQMDPLLGASNEGWDDYYKVCLSVVIQLYSNLCSSASIDIGFGDCFLH
jgi:hypothetical protein